MFFFVCDDVDEPIVDPHCQPVKRGFRDPSVHPSSTPLRRAVVVVVGVEIDIGIYFKLSVACNNGRTTTGDGAALSTRRSRAETTSTSDEILVARNTRADENIVSFFLSPQLRVSYLSSHRRRRLNRSLDDEEFSD